MTDIIKNVKRVLVCMVIMGGVTMLAPFSTVHAQAQPGPDPGAGTPPTGDCSARFLTFPAWYRGLVERNAEGECEIVSPTKFASESAQTGGFTKFIWTIVLNVIEIMLQAVGYASVGFIIYGGYKYIYSAGSPNGMTGAKKTIMNAVIGLIISLMSVGIVNTIAGGIR